MVNSVKCTAVRSRRPSNVAWPVSAATKASDSSLSIAVSVE